MPSSLSGMTLVNQAATILSDFTAGNGTLLPEQESQFREDLIAESKFLAMTDIHMLNSPSKQLSYLRVDPYPLSAPNTGATNRAVTAKGAKARGVTLETKLMRGQVSIADEVVNENIEGDSLLDVVLGLIAQECALQAEVYLLNGDTALAGKTIANAEEKRLIDFMALQNGVFKQASTNGLSSPAFSNADLPATAIGTLLAPLDDKYMRWATDYVAFTTQAHFNRFASTVMHRTQADNKFMMEKDAFGRRQIVFPEGNLLVPLNGMSEVITFTETGQSAVNLTKRDRVLFMKPDTLAVGFYMNNLRFHIDYDPYEWKVLINFEIYMGSALHYPDAVVIGTGVKV